MLLQRIERIEVLLQKDRKDRSAATRDREDQKAVAEDRSAATRDREDRKAVAEDRSAAAKDREDRSVAAKDQKIEVLLRRIERSKRCCKRIK